MVVPISRGQENIALPLAQPECVLHRLERELAAHAAEQKNIWGQTDELLISKYLAGTCTPSEHAQIEQAKRLFPAVRECLALAKCAANFFNIDLQSQLSGHGMWSSRTPGMEAMSAQQCLTIQTISDILHEEIAARSGAVFDVMHDGTRLFARSVVPDIEEVQPADQLQGGVALRATESEAWIYPYVFRSVCRNGAIMAHAFQARHLTKLNLRDAWDSEAILREAIQACCDPEAFATSIREFRSATVKPVDLSLSLLPLLARWKLPNTYETNRHIMDQFFQQGDQTTFGLANAVTAVARDTPDPEVRWRLEELGGSIAAGVKPPPPSRSPSVNIQNALATV